MHVGCETEKGCGTRYRRVLLEPVGSPPPLRELLRAEYREAWAPECEELARGLLELAREGAPSDAGPPGASVRIRSVTCAPSPKTE